MKGAVPKVLIGFTACVVVVATVIAFRPESSYTEAQDTVVYENSDFGYRLEFPSTWDMYEFDSANGLATQVAFDPDEVIVEEGLDLAPGRIWILATDGMPIGEGDQVTIGDGVEAAYFSERYGDNVPNGWWANRTDRRYYVTLGDSANEDYAILEIIVQYPNELEDDAATQGEIDRMLASFRFE